MKNEARAYMPQAKSTEYTTPGDLFDQLWEEFGPFDCDPCCQLGQYTANRVLGVDGVVCIPPEEYEEGYDHYHIKADGLAQPWRGRVFLNPPYGRQMPRWIERAVGMVEDGTAELALALIPSRTDTKMWQQYCLTEATRQEDWYDIIDAHEAVATVRFLPGRLKFGGMEDPAPFPSAVVVWRR